MENCWSEHNNPTEKTEPTRHLSYDIGHLFAWEILMPAPKDKETRKNLEAFFIAVECFTPFSKRHHMRDIFNDLNDFLIYFLLIL